MKLACLTVSSLLLIVVGTAIATIPHRSMQYVRNRTAFVDTRIGGGGEGWGNGNLNPGAQVPFGAMRLGPDTSIGLEPFRLEFNDMAGYHYDNNYIECFSHTHVVGAGEGDFQNFGVTVTRQLTNDVIRNCNYRSYYTHDQEVALPGYYAVNLLTPNVYAEVTVSGTHSGLHRYTARTNEPLSTQTPYLIIDICHGVTLGFLNLDIGAACVYAQILNVTTRDDGLSYEVDAWVFNRGDFSQSSNRGGIDIFFHAVVTASSVGSSSSSGTPLPLNFSTWEAGELLWGQWATNKTKSGSLGLAFSPTEAPVSDVQFLVRTAVSFVSSTNARLNLQVQQGVTSFDDAAQGAIDLWEQHQSIVSYSGGVAASDWHRTVFETAWYHVAMPPTTYSESNGQYVGEDWNVHEVASGRRYLSDLSIWDIYRTQAPLLLFIRPSVAVDLANSMMEMFHETNALPVWVFANVETDCMVGHHSAIIFADYVMKGLPNINNSAILDAVVSGIQNQNEENLASGYVSMESNQRGASLTQDFALDSGAAANLAAYLLGDNASVVASLRGFAQTYRNVWDNSTSYFCPRHSNGTFACDDPFNPYPFENKFTEGNGAEYRWYVPHDIDGLIGLFPNTSYFADELDTFFELSQLWPLNTTLPNFAYWAGNEPDILAPFLFLFAGNEYAYLTSYWVPVLLDKYYIPYASGVPGNDDYGTMSAWVVFSYLGIYPVASTTRYGLFAPRFDAIDITLDALELQDSPWRSAVNASASGSTTILSIRAYNRPASGTAYVAGIRVNGVNLTVPYLEHSQLLNVSPAGSSTLVEFFLTDIPLVFGTNNLHVHKVPRMQSVAWARAAKREALRAAAKLNASINEFGAQAVRNLRRAASKTRKQGARM